MTIRASASTHAAPPMSFFMSSMPAAGLDVESAGVEADALADERQLRMRGLAPAQVDQPRRVHRDAADGMDGRDNSRATSPSTIAAAAPCSARQRQRFRGEHCRLHVGRGRVDEVARHGERAGGALAHSPCPRRRRGEQRGRRPALRGRLIALETIASRRPSQAQRSWRPASSAAVAIRQRAGAGSRSGAPARCQRSMWSTTRQRARPERRSTRHAASALKPVARATTSWGRSRSGSRRASPARPDARLVRCASIEGLANPPSVDQLERIASPRAALQCHR